jgi:hypothetical protein
MAVEQHGHPEYATARDLNGIGGKVESMGERVAVNTERSKTNKEQITDLFELHRDTEKQVSRVSESVVKIRTQVTVAVAVIVLVLNLLSKLFDKFM